LPNETKATGDKAAEQIRLDESREKRSALEAMGTVGPGEHRRSSKPKSLIPAQ